MTEPLIEEKKQGERRNPFRGPREFARGDQLPNRRTEAEELTNLVIANRVVLLHAPSGAGKTSLIEAAVVKELEREGFRATPRLRVNMPAIEDSYNPYIQSLISYLLIDPSYSPSPHGMTLMKAFDVWEAGQERSDAGSGRMSVLIIDQLEEVLTSDPTDWSAQEAFFLELGQLLSARSVWAILSIREDYMGGLDRYLELLPGFLQTRYRLDYLTREDAKLAMQVPSQQQNVAFHDDAAIELGRKLAMVEIQQSGKETVHKEAPYVEPFQLQVVCRQLWKKIRRERGDDFPEITLADVERYVDIEGALTLYYGDTVTTVIKKTGADERAVRDWFETELITKNYLRGQTLNLPDTVNASDVLRDLESGYLIRGNLRGVTNWYELAHDRLVRAVLTSNETWRWEKLEPWQIAAHEWSIGDRNPAFLLSPRALRGLSSNKTKLTTVEREFLKESEAHAQSIALKDRLKARSWVGYLAVVEGALIGVLLVFVVVLLV